MKLKKYLPPLILTVLLYSVLHFINIGCPILYFTGIPCAGCGMTRAWLSALHLDFASAFHYHPLFGLVPILPVIFHLYHTGKIKKGIFYRLFSVIILIFIIVYFIRLFNPEDTIVKIHTSNSVFIQYVKYLLERRK